MSDVKFIDLDELTNPVVKRVKLFSTEHDVAELSIGNLNRAIELQDRLSKLHEEGDNADPAASLSAYVDLILISIPTLTKQDVDRLNLRQWMGLVSFITATGFEGSTTEEEGAEMGKDQGATAVE